MKADILLLAAGMGTRLGARTQARPKALVEVCGKALIDHVLDGAMQLPWVGRVVVVTGCKAELVQAHLSRRSDAKAIVQVHNPAYEKGNFYSLTAGLAEVGSEFLLMNVDHIYPRALLERLRQRAEGVAAVCDRDRPLTADCMKVWAEQPPDGAWRLRQIDKRLTHHNWGYIGMTFVSPEGRARYLQAVDRVRARQDPKAWAEMVLQELADHTEPQAAPRIVDASGFGWLEVDDERDLSHAEAVLRERSGFFL